MAIEVQRKRMQAITRHVVDWLNQKAPGTVVNTKELQLNLEQHNFRALSLRNSSRDMLYRLHHEGHLVDKGESDGAHFYQIPPVPSLAEYTPHPGSAPAPPLPFPEPSQDTSALARVIRQQAKQLAGATLLLEEAEKALRHDAHLPSHVSLAERIERFVVNELLD